jgi:hypothetical protein
VQAPSASKAIGAASVRSFFERDMVRGLSTELESEGYTAAWFNLQTLNRG